MEPPPVLEFRTKAERRNAGDPHGAGIAFATILDNQLTERPTPGPRREGVRQKIQQNRG
jgi:hypothetical protein